MHSPTDRLGLRVAIGHAEGSDTMRAWERFLTGGPGKAVPACNFVISSWRRSLGFGVDPTAARAAGRARR